jgi:5-formyltetrahydrofolate cyclo-ligase
MLAIVQLPPDMVKEIARRAKRAIRQRMRALRQALPERARAVRSQTLCERVLESSEFREAHSLGLFAPLPFEVDITPLDEAARSRGMSVYYPFMDPKPGGYTTGFRKLESYADLVSRGRSFLEPPPNTPAARRGDVDVIVVPAVALSADGQRLGFGSGFYDATLPDFCPPAATIGVAFDFQLLAELPTDEHDEPVQVIVTDQRQLRPGQT